ncbi:hypothetical protein EV356DRAFT_16834 [Viridothelium virens]|uniref:Uncharacterized protein n=1 Tax=Viridothelium virens TaxID=1048519 RepID=A0A6A6HH86_VIRVR|nr:hypothetical protein EV356DRAFT_16834 [Viridothelium virens]
MTTSKKLSPVILYNNSGDFAFGASFQKTPSTMSRAIAAKHYERILQAWPKDLLRPTVSLQKLLQKRLENQNPEPAVGSPASGSPASSPSLKQTAFSEGAELRQINALYSLLDNRYSKQYPVSKRLMNPTFDPTYYHRLSHEIEQAPNLSFFERLLRRVKARIRFS